MNKYSYADGKYSTNADEADSEETERGKDAKQACTPDEHGMSFAVFCALQSGCPELYL